MNALDFSPEPIQTTESIQPLSGKLYTYHGYRVVDVDGNDVGQVDWIWADDSGTQAEYLGVSLRWLRGTVRAIPARGATIDPAGATLTVAHTKHQIMRASRYSIDRPLSAVQKRAILGHYAPQLDAVRSRVRGRTMSRSNVPSYTAR